VEVREEAAGFVFVVTDDGAGFDVRGAGMGAGFTNMHDRLGALGGRFASSRLRAEEPG
jgi:signal transduction histidine kinase